MDTYFMLLSKLNKKICAVQGLTQGKDAEMTALVNKAMILEIWNDFLWIFPSLLSFPGFRSYGPCIWISAGLHMQKINCGGIMGAQVTWRIPGYIWSSGIKHLGIYF